MPTRSLGGAYVPRLGYNRSGATDINGTYEDGTFNGATLGAGAALTTPVIDGVTQSAANDRQIIVEAIPVDGDALGAANLPLWVAPTGGAIILRALLNVTTVATGAATVDIGYTAVSGTTSSNTLFDGVDVNGALALFDSMDATLASGVNAHAQLAAAAKWITADEASGDTAGMVATLYVFYILV